MHLPRAYRSLARPSSALEPSHPPDSITPVTPNQVQLASSITAPIHDFMYLSVNTGNPSFPDNLLIGCIRI